MMMVQGRQNSSMSYRVAVIYYFITVLGFLNFVKFLKIVNKFVSLGVKLGECRF